MRISNWPDFIGLKDTFWTHFMLIGGAGFLPVM